MHSRAPRAGSSLTLSDLYLYAACRLPRAVFVLMPSPAQCYRLCCEESLARATVGWCHCSARGLLVYEGVYTLPLPIEGRGIPRVGAIQSVRA